ncbi:MAG: DNA cytosine methyltransferase [Verrucomicrobiales bacterium]|nr:DNA cytosine methyltransferase [Verrucomicrobiales bacterium]
MSLFTGAGGLDLGFEAAGFETAVAVEMDDLCVETLRRNRTWPVIHGDIHQVSSSTILSEGKLRTGEAAVLIGGPPCQPFSKSGFWSTGDSKRLLGCVRKPTFSTNHRWQRVGRGQGTWRPAFHTEWQWLAIP